MVYCYCKKGGARSDYTRAATTEVIMDDNKNINTEPAAEQLDGSVEKLSRQDEIGVGAVGQISDQSESGEICASRSPAPASFKEKLGNFWYHYKWHTIVSTVVVVLIAVIAVQFVRQPKIDMNVIYAGGYQLSRLEIAGEPSQYETALGSLERIGIDVDGNGEVSINLQDFYYLTDEEIAALEAAGKGDSINYEKLMQDRDNLHASIMTGDACLMFLSEALFDELYSDTAFEGGKLFVDLSNYLSDSGAEGYEFYGEGNKAVRLSSLKFGELPTFNELPEDTVVCLRIKSDGFAGLGENSKTYDNSVALIKKLFAYEN